MTNPPREITTAAGGLADEDLAMLRFADQWWHDPAAREQAIRDRFGMAPVRFYQRLAFLMDQPAAQQAEPLLCARLRRIQQERSRLRRPSTVMGVTR